MIQMNLFLQNRKRLTDIENKVIMQGKDLAQSWNRQLPIGYWAFNYYTYEFILSNHTDVFLSYRSRLDFQIQGTGCTIVVPPVVSNTWMCSMSSHTIILKLEMVAKGIA